MAAAKAADATSLGTVQSSSFSESSRTASSRSAGTASQGEPDFTKDNSTSPIDLECNIQAERITKILAEAIYKTKLAICLPRLVQEYHTLNSILSDQHMEDLQFIFEQYENPMFSTSLLNVGAMEDIKGGDLSLKNRLNPELGHLIYIMNSYPALKPVVEKMIAEMRIQQEKQLDSDKKLATSQKPVSPGMEYLRQLERFRDQMLARMATTAAEELAAKFAIRKMEQTNERLVKAIEELSTTIREENEAFEANMRTKQEAISKLEAELNFLNNDAASKLKKKILDSDRQMVLASRAHAVKHELLKEEEQESVEHYETLLRNHLIEEKAQRARRFKVETQLQSWLQKYDLEMGDKQVELDEFTKQFQLELDRCDELEAQIEEQNQEYLPLMAEREEEYQAEMQAKMTKFMLDHAARVIQAFWREVLANRAEKKKLRKIQKKMQEQAAKKAAAAARAEKAAKAAEKAAAKAAKAARKKK